MSKVFAEDDEILCMPCPIYPPPSDLGLWISVDLEGAKLLQQLVCMRIFASPAASWGSFALACVGVRWFALACVGLRWLALACFDLR